MAEQWLAVAEAAEALGVSPATVRRRAKRQALRSRTGANGRLEVAAPAPDESNQGESNPPADEPDPTREQASAPAPGADRASPLAKGRYSPLPQDNVGTNPPPPDPGRYYARLTPGELLKPAENAPGSGADDAATDQPESELQRYQRLAGASVVLAQRQADEANEKLAIVRGQLRQLRYVCGGSWAALAAVVLIAIVTAGVFSGRAAEARAEADRAEQRRTAAVERQTELRSRVQQLQQQLDRARAEADADADGQPTDQLSQAPSEDSRGSRGRFR